MIREIVQIDEELCNGCGECVPNCHEGALQIIDGKARLISDLMCDGLGACIGHCPLGAITIEKREAEPYDEKKVMAIMTEKGKNTVVAHLEHLLEHNETGFYEEAIDYISDHEAELSFTLAEITGMLDQDAMKESSSVNERNVEQLQADGHEHNGQMQHQNETNQQVRPSNHHTPRKEPLACGCPGSAERSFQPAAMAGMHGAVQTDAPSQLSQWPVQMHLINPQAPFFRDADVVLAADCVAYALGNFHQKYLKGKSLAIACPKLDQGPDIYVEKIRSMIDDAKINTLHLMIMQVPCCGGLRKIVEMARSQAVRNVPVKQSIVGVQGEILSEEWI